MRWIPPSAGFRFPSSRKLSWRPKWSFQSPSPSWHPCLSVSVIISRYGTQSIGEVFIASHSYQESFAVLSSVVSCMSVLITSFPCKSKSISSKITSALRLDILPGAFFLQHLQPAGCCFSDSSGTVPTCPWYLYQKSPLALTLNNLATHCFISEFAFWRDCHDRTKTICFSCIEEQGILYGLHW